MRCAGWSLGAVLLVAGCGTLDTQVFLTAIEARDAGVAGLSVDVVFSGVGKPDSCACIDLEVRSLGGRVIIDGEAVPSGCIPMTRSCRRALLPEGAVFSTAARVVVVARSRCGPQTSPQSPEVIGPCEGPSLDEAVWPLRAPTSDSGASADDAGNAEDAAAPDAPPTDAAAADAGGSP